MIYKCIVRHCYQLKGKESKAVFTCKTRFCNSVSIKYKACSNFSIQLNSIQCVSMGYLIDILSHKNMLEILLLT